MRESSSHAAPHPDE